jgi:hypothetical protein
MVEIVWRNPRPPAPRSLRVTQVAAAESTLAPMWIIFYHTVHYSGWPENEYQLLVKRSAQHPIAV